MKVEFTYINVVTEEKKTVTRAVLGTPDRASLINYGRAYEREVGGGFRLYDFTIVDSTAVIRRPVKVQRVWCRVRDCGDPFLQWVPGYKLDDGTVLTALGEMTNPDNEKEDCKDFSDCPFEGYKTTEV